MHKLPFLLTLTCGIGFTLAQDLVPVPSDEPLQVAKALPATAEAAPTATVPDDSPVQLPALGHFARLWTDSLFTTRAMPMPEAPAGPNFTDNLTLSGTIEDHGKLTAILIDKTTSNILQAYIGEDNEQGIRISKITPGATPDQMRIQLQKGNMVGWVTFTDATTAPESVAASIPAGQAVIPGRAPANAGRPPAPMIPQALPYVPPAAEPIMPQGSMLRGGMPAAIPALPDDPPLPPP